MPTGTSLPSPLKIAFVALLTSALALTPPPTLAQGSPTANPINVQSLVNQMTDLDNLATFRAYANTSGVESSDDPSKRTTYFFSDTDGGNFQRDIVGASGHTEHVMIDMTGPGMLTRFFLAGPPAAGTIRFYMDGGANPVYTNDLNSMMQGNAGFGSPFLYKAGPNTISVGGTSPTGGTAEVPTGLDLYLPIPFANRIVVTYDGPSRGTYPIMDYIWEYTRFQPGVVVQSWDGKTTNATPATYPLGSGNQYFTRQQAQPENTAITTLQPDLWNDTSNLHDVLASGTKTSGVVDNNGTITIPGGGSIYQNFSGPQAIRFLQAKVSQGSGALPTEADLEHLILTMHFQSNGRPWDMNAVNESIGDFFGSGEGFHPGQTQMQNVNTDGTMQMRWVMPFGQNATIKLSNNGTSPITVTFLADIRSYNWDSNYSMHFHAIREINGPMYMYSSDLDYSQNPPRPITKAHTMRMMYIQGKGTLVGDSETVINGQPAYIPGTSTPDRSFNWWGEGDELMYVDNSPFPTHRGTGSEDYYGYAYGHTYLFQSPWTSQTSVPPQSSPGQFDYDLPATVLNRVRLQDAVPFNNAFRYDFEVHENDDPWDEVLIDHTSYFYVVPDGTYRQLGDGVNGLASGSTYTIESKQNGWLLTTHGGDPATTDPPAGLGQQRFTLRQISGNTYNLQSADINQPNQYLSCCRPVNGANTLFLYNLNGSTGSCDQQWTISDEQENAPDVQIDPSVPVTHKNDYQTLVNACGSNSAADVVSAATKAGTVVQGYTNNTSQTSIGQDTSQVWRFNFVPSNFLGGTGAAGKNDPILPNGVYEIRNTEGPNNLAIDVPNASTNNAQGLQVYTSNGSNAQLWVVNYIGNGIYSIINVNSGLALDDGGGGNGTQAVQYYNQNVSTNQQWAFIQQDNSSNYLIKNIATGQFLSMGGTQAAGSPLTTQPQGNVPWQAWFFQPITY